MSFVPATACDGAPSPYARLGRTGLEISRLVIGTVNFGGRVDEPEAIELLDHAVGRGINTVDTADIEALGPWLDWAWAESVD